MRLSSKIVVGVDKEERNSCNFTVLICEIEYVTLKMTNFFFPVKKNCLLPTDFLVFICCKR